MASPMLLINHDALPPGVVVQEANSSMPRRTSTVTESGKLSLQLSRSPPLHSPPDQGHTNQSVRPSKVSLVCRPLVAGPLRHEQTSLEASETRLVKGAGPQLRRCIQSNWQKPSTNLRLAPDAVDLSKTDIWKEWRGMLLKDMPFLQVLAFMQAPLTYPLQRDTTAQDLPPHDVSLRVEIVTGFLTRPSLDLASVLPSLFRSHDETLQSAGALSWEIDPFHFLSRAIFRLSNCLVERSPLSREDRFMHKILFTRIPAAALRILLHSDLPSGRAAHKELLKLTASMDDQATFSLMASESTAITEMSQLSIVNLLLKHRSRQCLELAVQGLALNISTATAVARLLVDASWDHPYLRSHYRPLVQWLHSYFLASSAEHIHTVQSQTRLRIREGSDSRYRFDFCFDYHSLANSLRTWGMSEHIAERLGLLPDQYAERTREIKILQWEIENHVAPLLLASRSGQRRCDCSLSEAEGLVVCASLQDMLKQMIGTQQFHCSAQESRNAASTWKWALGTLLWQKYAQSYSKGHTVRSVIALLSLQELLLWVVDQLARSRTSETLWTILDSVLDAGATFCETSLRRAATSYNNQSLLQHFHQMGADIAGLGAPALTRERGACRLAAPDGVDANAVIDVEGIQHTILGAFLDDELRDWPFAIWSCHGKVLNMTKLLTEAGTRFQHTGIECQPFGALRGLISRILGEAELAQAPEAIRTWCDEAALVSPEASVLLEACVESEAWEVMQFLLDAGTPVANSPVLATALLTAVADGGDVELAMILLEKGADPNLAPGCRWPSALDSAAGRGRLDMVQLLLNAGGTSTRQGATAYDGAIEIAQRRDHGEVSGMPHRYLE
ncbi:uncharacterized protein B0I36DRAFT_352690 [Microdochium trichocladiopsis]|uniref:Ankyrin repeat-containing domain protein n=1 Tax=Microdochium trichocladiopsis TaxID=1682393 RepID=A0A9P9BPE2_9PEZI|nr:uncharacterized protein B0I36DRAFT_352690 [Microdochium trichocladiopsis]KAH7024461.1 hypothetical protein B0I36DRAFT_352690 [Microdochium trichocladiopsis]